MTNELPVRSTKRDDYFRCPVCKKLFSDTECTLDPIKGYICPNGCVRQYVQPSYQSPFDLND